MKAIKFAVLLLAANLIWQCSNVPITSIPKIRKIDFETTDVGKLRAVVKIPDAIDISKVEVNFEVVLESEGEVLQHSTTLQRYEGDPATKALFAREAEDGFNMAAFRVPPSDYAKINAMRKTALEWDAAGRSGRGGTGMAIEHACYLPDRDVEGLKGDLWVSTEETGGYVLFLRNVNLSKSELEKNGGDFSKLQCD